jgi:hypothetical protein
LRTVLPATLLEYRSTRPSATVEKRVGSSGAGQRAAIAVSGCFGVGADCILFSYDAFRFCCLPRKPILDPFRRVLAVGWAGWVNTDTASAEGAHADFHVVKLSLPTLSEREAGNNFCGRGIASRFWWGCPPQLLH